MNATEAADYRVMKETILRRYDLNCEAYVLTEVSGGKAAAGGDTSGVGGPTP